MARPAPILDIPEMRRIKRIHFIGVGGAGMCGIAEVLAHQGYQISGSDSHPSATTRRLQSLGIKFMQGHDPCHIEGADVVVVSSAIAADNSEVEAARQARVPVVRRAEMLGELMRYRHGIAVAGTHGKTTTTSLIASIFAEAGLDPTFIIGGLLNSAGSNAKLGASRYLVAEADESDASFLHLQPMVAVLTNVDRDHLAYYEGSFDRLKQAFVEFVHHLPFYGLLVACIDDPVVRSLLPSVERPVITYGFDPAADIQAIDECQSGFSSSFQVRRNINESASGQPLQLQVKMPGHHNVLNALAAIAVATDEGISDANIEAGLAKFAGVARRFQLHGHFTYGQGDFCLVDDYGHHPSEVKATIEAVRRGWPDRRLVMIYQPHRYSRTLDLFDQFVDVLSQVDLLLLVETYPAGEEEVPGARGEDLYRQLKLAAGTEVIFLPTAGEVEASLEGLIKEGDFLVTQGAGETAGIARALTEKWQDRRLA